MDHGGEGLVGRTDELDEALRALDRSLGGEAGLTLVTGEAGIGKTRLAREIAGRARASGVDVHWSSCWEGATSPFWPWLLPLREVAGPAADALLHEQSRVAAFESVAESLSGAARARPMLIVIDDVHLADASSVALLHFLAERLRVTPLALFATMRSEEQAADELTTLMRSSHVITLSGLDDEAVAVLLGSKDDELLRRIQERTRGNPLFVLEFVRLMRSHGTGTPAGELPVPQTVRMLISRRLAYVSGACLDALAAAAVIGQEFALEQLDALAGHRVTPLLDEAEAAGLVARAGPLRWGFSHPLIRETLEAGLPASERRRLHLAIANMLREQDEDLNVTDIAHHTARALPDGDVAVAREFARRAGERAIEMSAFENAVQHLSRALELAGDDDVEIRLSLGDALARSGKVVQAADVFDAALATARRKRRPDEFARAALGLTGGTTGFEVRLFDARGLDALREALDNIGDGDMTLRAQLLARLSVASTGLEDISLRTALSEEAVNIARAIGDDATLAVALGSLCDAKAAPAHTVERAGLADEMIDAGIVARHAEAELLGRRFRIIASLELGDIAEVDAQIDAFARTAIQMRQPSYAWFVPLWRGTRALMEGRLDEADRRNEEARSMGARAGSVNAAILCDAQRLQILMERDLHEEAVTLLGRFVEDPEGGPNARAYYAAMFARAGREDEARAALERVIASGFDMTVDAVWLQTTCLVAEAAYLLNELRAAEPLVELLSPYADRFAVGGIGAGCFGSVRTYLGLLASILGHTSEAVEHLEAAERANRALGAPLLAATTRRRLEAVRSRSPRPETESATQAVLVRDGAGWEIIFEGRRARVANRKGFDVIARLVAEPGREYLVLDLVVSDPQLTEAMTGAASDVVLDARARSAIERRLAELADDAELAEAIGDGERAARALAERDAIATELGRALGLGGRVRSAPDATERARTAVTKQIKSALDHLEQTHSAAAQHLRNSIRTGRFCSYRPERMIHWEVGRGAAEPGG